MADPPSYPPKTINDDLLTHELRKRPELYEIILRPFSQNEAKWQQIFERIYPDWHHMDERQKEFRGAELRTRFYSLNKTIYASKTKFLVKKERQKYKHAQAKKDKKIKDLEQEKKELKKKLKVKEFMNKVEAQSSRSASGEEDATALYRKLSHKDFALSLIPILEMVPIANKPNAFAEVADVAKRHAKQEDGTNKPSASTSTSTTK